MPSLTELASYLESIAPAQIAESWDNVGVLVRCAQEVTGVLCALDITPATVREARAVGCNAVSYECVFPESGTGVLACAYAKTL